MAGLIRYDMVWNKISQLLLLPNAQIKSILSNPLVFLHVINLMNNVQNVY